MEHHKPTGNSGMAQGVWDSKEVFEMKHDSLSDEWMEELMPKALIIGFVAFVFAIIVFYENTKRGKK